MSRHLTEKLAERSRQDNKRTLSSSPGMIDFVSNDYLGMARSEGLHQKILSYSYENVVNKNGSTGSRLLAGNSVEAEDLERKLAHVFAAQSALLFNSGYAANLAIMSSVAQKGDTILYDSLSHVCIKEGAWLSKATTISFRHNDIEDLEQKIQRAEGEVFVVIESVYSMDGDIAPLREIVNLKNKYDIKLIIDEAHSTGVYGPSGAGLLCELGLENSFFARVYTFGKGLGVHGACICGSSELKDYLINFGRSFIYTTALPMHSIFSIDAALDYLKENDQLQNDISEKISFFNNAYKDILGDMNGFTKSMSTTPIQPIIVPGNARVKDLAVGLQSAGFDVRPILAPTVKAGAERLRVSLHTHNTFDEIERLLNKIQVLA